MKPTTGPGLAAAILLCLAMAEATAGETTTETRFAAIAQLPVTALSTSEMADTRGAGDTSGEYISFVAVVDGIWPESSSTGVIVGGNFQIHPPNKGHP